VSIIPSILLQYAEQDWTSDVGSLIPLALPARVKMGINTINTFFILFFIVVAFL
jgi:hypothetical protein